MKPTFTLARDSFPLWPVHYLCEIKAVGKKEGMGTPPLNRPILSVKRVVGRRKISKSETVISFSPSITSRFRVHHPRRESQPKGALSAFLSDALACADARPAVCRPARAAPTGPNGSYALLDLGPARADSDPGGRRTEQVLLPGAQFGTLRMHRWGTLTLPISSPLSSRLRFSRRTGDARPS